MPNLVSFSGKLVGRGLSESERATCVILTAMVINARPVASYRNVACTPVKAFADVPSFHHGTITGVGELENRNGEPRLINCRSITAHAPIVPDTDLEL